MRILIAVTSMILWSVFIWAIMDFVGFSDHINDPLWSLGAAIMLLIGLVGNVWIFFLIAKETPWQWGE